MGWPQWDTYEAFLKSANTCKFITFSFGNVVVPFISTTHTLKHK